MVPLQQQLPVCLFTKPETQVGLNFINNSNEFQLFELFIHEDLI